MLIAAGLLFFIAVGLFIIDKISGVEDLHLNKAVKLCVISAAILICIHTYQKNKGPETAVAQEEVQNGN